MDMPKFEIQGLIIQSRINRLGRTWIKPQPIMFLWPFVAHLAEQLASDQERWGDEWLERGREGQEGRIFNRLLEYHGEWLLGSKPIPWLKVAGLALIGWIRENFPELSK